MLFQLYQTLHTSIHSHSHFYKNIQVASWAGNVMLKYHNREFPSDVTTVLESLNARIVVWDSEAGIVEKFGSIFARKNCECFMSTNMSKKVKK